MTSGGNKRAELTVATFQYFGTASALYLVTPLQVNGREQLVLKITDTVGGQLADCSPHCYQVVFSIKEKSLKKEDVFNVLYQYCAVL